MAFSRQEYWGGWDVLLQRIFQTQGSNRVAYISRRLLYHSVIGGNPLQYSCWENPRDGRVWWAAVYGVAQSWMRLKWLSVAYVCPMNEWASFLNKFPDIGLAYLLEKAVAPHSSTLAWKIPWVEEPGRLQSMGSLRVGHYWATSLSLFTFMHWRRKWQPTPVFLPGESQGRGSLVGCHLWGCTESDTTETTAAAITAAYLLVR